jgi:parallel beta-helix repeat protein
MAYHIGRLKVLNNTFEGPEIATINIEKARLNNPAGAPFRSPGERILIEGNQGGEIWIKDSAAIAVRKNTVGYIWLSKSEVTLIEENVVRRGSVTAALSGIMVEASSDVVIQKNIVEENEYGIRIEGDDAGIRRTAVAILSSRLVRNGWGIVTERLEYVTVCQNNEVMENQKGDYAVGSFSPQPSPELKQRCE